MVKNSKTRVKSPVKSPRKRLLLARTNGIRSRPQTAPGGPSGSTQGNAGSSSNIKVVVRVRPPNTREQGDNQRIVIKVVDEQLLIFDPEEESQPFFYHGVQQRGRDLLKKTNKNIQFLFDRVFGFEATNEAVFEHSTKDLINSLMDGYNCSVFVYGATGAGKTHTMLGHNKNPGITFLTMAELFRQKQQLISERDFELGVSYLEVYNENVQDLLNPGTALHLREDGNYGVVVAGIQINRIEEPKELFELLDKGNKNRTQHPTVANAESSRSHAVFQVYLRMNIRATGQVRLVKLSMIDLAGSERGAATGCSGDRFTEGANINKSLLALGNCINSLADGQRHIPYRDSKLTRLLKDSLGGNCQTVMIANISPSSLSYEDTYNTLKYATRAKKIKSHMKKNVVNCEMHVGQYVKMIEELKKEIEKLKADAVKSATFTQPSNTSKEKCASKNVLVELPEKNRLLELFTERIKIQEQIHRIKSSEIVLELQCQMKSDFDSRLSGLCITNIDKEKGHRRLGGALERLRKEAENVKSKLSVLQNKRDNLRLQVENLLEEKPELVAFSKYETLRLLHLEQQHENEQNQKVISLYKGEVQKKGELLENAVNILKPCYLQLRGIKAAPEDMVVKYKQLVRQMQGIEAVTWQDDVFDSGVSSTTSMEEDNKEGPEHRPRGKRKYSNNELNLSTEDLRSPLDTTFILENITPSKTGCAEQLLSKGHGSNKKSATVKSLNNFNACAERILTKAYEPPPAKRAAKIRSNSLKENRPSRTIGTMGTAQRFPSAMMDNEMVGRKLVQIKKKILQKTVLK